MLRLYVIIGLVIGVAQYILMPKIRGYSYAIDFIVLVAFNALAWPLTPVLILIDYLKRK